MRDKPFKGWIASFESEFETFETEEEAREFQKEELGDIDGEYGTVSPILIYTPAQIETLVRDLVEELHERRYAIAEDILEKLKKEGYL